MFIFRIFWFWRLLDKCVMCWHVLNNMNMKKAYRCQKRRKEMHFEVVGMMSEFSSFIMESQDSLCFLLYMTSFKEKQNAFRKIKVVFRQKQPHKRMGKRMKLKTNFSLRADTYASKSAIAFHFCFVHSLLIVWLYGRLKKSTF